MKKQMILYLLILAGSVSLFAQSDKKEQTFTLKEAIDYALSSNYGQQILEISKAGTKEEVAQSK